MGLGTVWTFALIVVLAAISARLQDGLDPRIMTPSQRLRGSGKRRREGWIMGEFRPAEEVKHKVAAARFSAETWPDRG